MNEIELSDITKAIWTKKWIFFAIIILFIGIAFIYIKITDKKEYCATALVIVNTKDLSQARDNSIDYEINKQIINTCKEIILSNSVLERVKNNLDIKYDINDNVYADIIKDTDVIKVKALNTDAKISAEIVNDIISVSKEKIQEIYKNDYLVILDNAEIPTLYAAKNNTKKILIITGIGIVIALFTVFIIYSNDKNKN